MEIDFFKQHITGIISSIKTPFLLNGEIDYQGLRNFIEFALEAGAKTVLLTPGDSLYNVLTDNEIADVTKFAAKAIGKRAMFLAASDYWWTGKTTEYVRYACDAGADAVLVSPPERGMTVQGLVDYYKTVSQERPVFILSAGLSSVGMQGALKTVSILLEEAPNVMGFKEDYEPRFAQQACLLAHDKWAIFAGGAKQTHMDMLPYGCDGYMSVFITYKPKIAHAYWKAIEESNLRKAVEIIRDYDLPLFKFIYSEFAAGGDAAQHGMLEVAGICGRWRRNPLPNLTDADMDKLRYFLKEHGMAI